MAIKTVSLNELSKELGAYAEDQFKQVREATVEGCLRSLPALVQASPIDTGQYGNSWDVSGIFGSLNDPVTIGNFAPHAPIIEYGARPFTPPIGPLLAWAKRVLQDPSQPPGYSPEVWALARGTQRKISIHGMAPQHVMQKNIPLILENIKREYQRRE